MVMSRKRNTSSEKRNMSHAYRLVYVRCGAIPVHWEESCTLNDSTEEIIVQAICPEIQIIRHGNVYLYALPENAALIRAIPKPPEINPIHWLWKATFKISPDSNAESPMLISLDPGQNMPTIINETVYDCLNPDVIAKTIEKINTARERVRTNFNIVASVHISVNCRVHEIAIAIAYATLSPVIACH